MTGRHMRILHARFFYPPQVVNPMDRERHRWRIPGLPPDLRGVEKLTGDGSKLFASLKLVEKQCYDLRCGVDTTVDSAAALLY